MRSPPIAAYSFRVLIRSSRVCTYSRGTSGLMYAWMKTGRSLGICLMRFLVTGDSVKTCSSVASTRHEAKAFDTITSRLTRTRTTATIRAIAWPQRTPLSRPPAQCRRPSRTMFK